MKDGIEILKQWLIEHGWDGLSNPADECGCGTDDFMPCDRAPGGCYPAKGNWEDGFYAIEEAENVEKN